jgi:hypothetical protein
MNDAPFFDALVADLRPVRRISPAMGGGVIALGTCAAIATVSAWLGLRTDIMAGSPAGIVLLRAGALLLLGCAALSAVIAAVRPSVGQQASGWRWALGAAALFPLVTLALIITGGGLPDEIIFAHSARYCLGVSISAASIMGLALAIWARRGAPVAISRTAALIGLSAGAFATFAYSLHCPSNDLVYAGIWYSFAVASSTVLGRIALPPLLRW